MKLEESITWKVTMVGKTSSTVEVAKSDVVVEVVSVWKITGVVVITVVNCPVVEISVFVAVIVVKEFRVCDWNYCDYSSKRYRNCFCRSIDCKRLWPIGCARKDRRNWRDLLLIYCNFKCVLCLDLFILTNTCKGILKSINCLTEICLFLVFTLLHSCLHPALNDEQGCDSSTFVALFCAPLEGEETFIRTIKIRLLPSHVHMIPWWCWSCLAFTEYTFLLRTKVRTRTESVKRNTIRELRIYRISVNT